MKSTWNVVSSCIAAAAIAFGCGGSSGSGGAGGDGGDNGWGGTGGGKDTCTETSVPGPLIGTCNVMGITCIEFRGSGTGMTEDIVRQSCGSMGTFQTTPCEKEADYLGSCLSGCGTTGENVAVYDSMGGLVKEDDMKASCKGKWFK